MSKNCSVVVDCRVCGVVKEWWEASSVMGMCVDCRDIEWNEKYQKIRDSEMNSEAGVLMRRNKRWYDKNMYKVRAGDLVAKAIRDGLLIKPKKCSECGAGGEIQGHHKDYDKPLEVIWLCKPCHNKAHQYIQFGTWEKAPNGKWIKVIYE